MVVKLKKFNLILLLIFWFQCSKAQRLELKFNILDTITPELNKTLAPSTHATFDDIKIHLKEINSKLLNNGYLTTYIDSTIQNDSIVIAKIFIGRQYL